MDGLPSDDAVCTDNCGFLEARCVTSTLSAGRYRVELTDAQAVEFEVGNSTVGDSYGSP